MCLRNIVSVVLYRSYSKGVMEVEETISHSIAWIAYIATYYSGYIITWQTMGTMGCYEVHACCYGVCIMGTC